MKLYDAVITRLTAVMSQRGASTYTLHREGGIAKSTLSQLFNHKQSKISLDILFEILSTINVTMREFFDDPIFDDVTD